MVPVFVATSAVTKEVPLSLPETISVPVTRRRFSQQEKFGGKCRRGKEGEISRAPPESRLGNHSGDSGVSDAVHACSIFVVPGGGCAFAVCDIAQTRRQLAERSCDL